LRVPGVDSLVVFRPVTDVAEIQLSVLYLGSLNLCLLRGEPLTLVDDGCRLFQCTEVEVVAAEP
jgi:hypothetical protein